MSAMSDVFLCGGDCVEDVNESEYHLRESPEIFGCFSSFLCFFRAFLMGLALFFGIHWSIHPSIIFVEMWLIFVSRFALIISWLAVIVSRFDFSVSWFAV